MTSSSLGPKVPTFWGPAINCQRLVSAVTGYHGPLVSLS